MAGAPTGPRRPWHGEVAPARPLCEPHGRPTADGRARDSRRGGDPRGVRDVFWLGSVGRGIHGSRFVRGEAAAGGDRMGTEGPRSRGLRRFFSATVDTGTCGQPSFSVDDRAAGVGYYSPHIWGSKCGQLGRVVDGAGWPPSSPRMAQPVHDSSPGPVHIRGGRPTSEDEPCPHNPQHLLLRLNFLF